MSGWIVGVDAGGTKSRAAAFNPTTGELRETDCEGANWTVHGPTLCRQRLTALVRDAIPAGEPLSSLCVCMAGYYPPDHRAEAEAWASATWAGVPVRIEPDYLAAWAGAHGGEPGIVVIAGTGSIAYGRNSAGDEARAGGWGPLFGDEGSAYSMGVQVLRLLAKEVDEDLPRSPLAERVIAHAPDLGTELTPWLRGVYRSKWSREQIAALSQHVDAVCDHDPIAEFIITITAFELGRLAKCVQKRLGEPSLAVVLTGGVGLSKNLRDELPTFLRRAAGDLKLGAGEFPPTIGALLLAITDARVAEAVKSVAR